jgi:hypothetical protein
VVLLPVVGHDVVDLGRVHQIGYPLKHLVTEGPADRVDEGYLVVNYQVGVVRCPLIGGVVGPVKLPDIPIDRSDPVDIWGYLNPFHHS